VTRAWKMRHAYFRTHRCIQATAQLGIFARMQRID
jgi:hypothetical protein